MSKTVLAKSATPLLVEKLPASLSDCLETHKHTQISPFQYETSGFIPPISDDGNLVRTVGNISLFALRIDRKMLPGCIVNARVDELAEEIERTTGYKPGRKSRVDIKERALTELLPRAFTKTQIIRAWIDRDMTAPGYSAGLVIDSASGARVDDMLIKLHKAGVEFGNVVSPMSSEITRRPDLYAYMSVWLQNCDAPAGFSLDNRCAIAAGESTVRMNRKVLCQAEIQPHMASGAICEELALTHADRISFVLSSQKRLKGIKYLDIDAAEALGNHGELPDIESARDAEIALTSGLVRDACQAITEAMIYS